jgi:predicted flavoprotein YhiN
MKAGITGHQHLGGQENAAWVAEQIEQAIVQNQVAHGYTSLALGADQIFARTLRQRGLPYTAIIPCQDYELTFQTSEHLEHYQTLLQSAANIIVLDFKAPEEAAFFAAGKRVVELADFMIAVWNGLPAKGLGGTADVVQYAREMKKRVMHLNPISFSATEL